MHSANYLRREAKIEKFQKKKKLNSKQTSSVSDSNFKANDTKKHNSKSRETVPFISSFHLVSIFVQVKAIDQ
jgi:hypothetical protein